MSDTIDILKDKWNRQQTFGAHEVVVREEDRLYLEYRVNRDDPNSAIALTDDKIVKDATAHFGKLDTKQGVTASALDSYVTKEEHYVPDKPEERVYRLRIEYNKIPNDPANLTVIRSELAKAREDQRQKNDDKGHRLDLLNKSFGKATPIGKNGAQVTFDVGGGLVNAQKIVQGLISHQYETHENNGNVVRKTVKLGELSANPDGSYSAQLSNLDEIAHYNRTSLNDKQAFDKVVAKADAQLKTFQKEEKNRFEMLKSQYETAEHGGKVEPDGKHGVKISLPGENDKVLVQHLASQWKAAVAFDEGSKKHVITIKDINDDAAMFAKANPNNFGIASGAAVATFSREKKEKQAPLIALDNKVEELKTWLVESNYAELGKEIAAVELGKSYKLQTRRAEAEAKPILDALNKAFPGLAPTEFRADTDQADGKMTIALNPVALKNVRFPDVTAMKKETLLEAFHAPVDEQRQNAFEVALRGRRETLEALNKAVPELPENPFKVDDSALAKNPAEYLTKLESELTKAKEAADKAAAMQVRAKAVQEAVENTGQKANVDEKAKALSETEQPQWDKINSYANETRQQFGVLKTAYETQQQKNNVFQEAEAERKRTLAEALKSVDAYNSSFLAEKYGDLVEKPSINDIPEAEKRKALVVVLAGQFADPTNKMHDAIAAADTAKKKAEEAAGGALPLSQDEKNQYAQLTKVDSDGQQLMQKLEQKTGKLTQKIEGFTRDAEHETEARRMAAEKRADDEEKALAKVDSNKMWNIGVPAVAGLLALLLGGGLSAGGVGLGSLATAAIVAVVASVATQFATESGPLMAMFKGSA